MREDIDIRLLDYFYYSHSAVDKTNSLVVIETQSDTGTNESEEKRSSESNEKH